MARGTLRVRGRDGGIAPVGPGGPATYAAIGVSALAEDISSQQPVTVTDPDDVETLLGRGPLRDLLVTALDRSGGTVVALPLQRSSGGGPLPAGSQTSGALTATASGHALGGQDVVLECVTGGAAGTATFRLIVDGVPGDEFTPASGDFGSNLATTGATPVLGEDELGGLASGVAAADRFTVNITSATFVAGEQLTWLMLQPQADGASMDEAVDRLRGHEIPWQWVACADCQAPATWSLLDTAVRGLEDQGRFAFAMVQAAGPDLRTGATAVQTTAAWVSGLLGGLTGAPAYQMAPRLQIMVPWVQMQDPIYDRPRVWPALYSYVGHLAALQVWQPPDATKYGPLEGVQGIYPADLSGANIDALDNRYYTTLQTHPGRRGVYVTHARMWGQPPQAGVSSTDFTGVERRRVMDEAQRRVEDRFFPHLNEDLPTNREGFLTEGIKAFLAGEGNAALRTLREDAAITAGEVTIRETARGILRDERFTAAIRITPRAKATDIRGDVVFFVAPVGSSEAA